MNDEPTILSIDEGKGLVPIVTIRHGHIDQVDAMRAIARGARRAEIRQGDLLLYAIYPVSPKSTQYVFITLAGMFFGSLAELPEVIATLEARSDRGY